MLSNRFHLDVKVPTHCGNLLISVILPSTSNASHAHMHTYGQFSLKIRRILQQTPKKKLIKLGESLAEHQSTPDKSISTAETLSSLASTDNEHRICLFSDSPHYIVRVRMYHRIALACSFSRVSFRWLEREMFKNVKRFLLTTFRN